MIQGCRIVTPGNQNPDLPLTVAEMTELAGGLAHELRNPLSTMMVNLKLLAEDLGDTDAAGDDVRRRALKRVDVLRREAERLQSLFDDFLNTTGPCRLNRKPENIHELIRRVASFFEPLALDHGITIEVTGDDAPFIAHVDEKLLNQAILNLVINAQEAMPGGGRLVLACHRENNSAVISVADTGVGIAPELKDRVMRPFFSTKGTGTGLGLSVARRAIIEHGGELSLDSRPGVGTTFTITIPLADD